jgi:deoxyguanosine kinase
MYIAIEGVIGVGKTSLARMIQPEFDAELLLEIFEENPFLSDFYGDRRRYAFQTQIFFLLSRYRQQRSLSDSLASNGSLIADYTFQKDAIFAQLNLDGDELDTYFLVHNALAESIHPPDLTVYLHVETSIAMQRIALRDRPYERNMAKDYIGDLNQAYEDYFATFESPLLKIETSSLDFVANRDHLTFIADRIKARLGIPPYQRELPFQEGDK